MKMLFFHNLSPDKDQDGSFNWVDKSKIEFSNYGPGWPKNTANLWDCGQIFTGRIRTLNLTLSRVSSWGWHRMSSALFQGIMTAGGRRPTASRATVTFVRWRADRTPNPPQLLVSQASWSRLHRRSRWSYRLCNKRGIVSLQIPTATLDTCCTGTSAISSRPKRWRTGRMLRPTVSKSRVTWPASTRRRSWVSSLVSHLETIPPRNYNVINCWCK